MKTLSFLLTIIFSFVFFFSTPVAFGFTSGGPTQCSGSTVSFSNVEKRLLPLPSENNCSSTLTGTCGRVPTKCITPKYIVIHTTWGITSAAGTYDYFAAGTSRNGVRFGLGCHFTVGTDGKVIQMVEMLGSTVEKAFCVSNYSEQISIEMGSTGDYANKAAMSSAQYQAVFNLVRNLMAQYKIPVGSLEYDWKAPSNAFTAEAGPGVYGHYQLNPETKSDPGDGWLKDFRAELKNAGPGNGGLPGGGTQTPGKSKCVVTKVGNPANPPEIPPECRAL